MAKPVDPKIAARETLAKRVRSSIVVAAVAGLTDQHGHKVSVRRAFRDVNRDYNFVRYELTVPRQWIGWVPFRFTQRAVGNVNVYFNPDSMQIEQVILSPGGHTGSSVIYLVAPQEKGKFLSQPDEAWRDKLKSGLTSNVKAQLGLK